ncbi:MAG: fatty acid desaturase [bacterium]|nr:fatty acid desaturase [bacterium]
MTEEPKLDYSLTGKTSEEAVARGLASAAWYHSPIPRDQFRSLLARRNGPAVRDTLLWFALLFGTGYWGYLWWGSLWAAIPFALYGVLYASSSDSRWHESSHGTAFKSDWMNNALYELASFMVFRESTCWRWSHNRHHSDTIIVGRDPEIAVPRPADLFGLFLAFFAVRSTRNEFGEMLLHAAGKMKPDEKTYIPESEYGTVFFKARIYLLIYASVIGSALYFRSVLPLMYIGFPTFYGSWLMVVFGLTQHAGLAENVLDHRLNCRTVYMNPIFRYLYWNMNYHVEHHMFPLVPYHAVPRLHNRVKPDMPEPYNGLWAAYREIIPALVKQSKDPSYFVERVLPAPSSGSSGSDRTISSQDNDMTTGWVAVCGQDDLKREDVIPFEYKDQIYAIYRGSDGVCYASEGLCSHGKACLADGVVLGNAIECPKHNGRFDLRDGSPVRSPARAPIKMYAVKVAGGKVWIDLGEQTN